MYLIYSFLLTFAFILMSPLFLLRREKYAAGFGQRLGTYPEFKHDGRKVIWLHCVSVGEINAARPLVDSMKTNFPDHRLIVSTTTNTGQKLAQKIFNGKAETVFYFPFDWKFSVRRALRHFKPDIVLLMETEIWPRFLREARLTGVKTAIVNGRISAKSFTRYSWVKRFVSKVLSNVDLALMQGEADAERIEALGITAERVKITGNIKFDHSTDPFETELTEKLSERFGINGKRPLIVAASTHEPEEKWIINAFASAANDLPEPRPRLLIAPRHSRRFDSVADLIRTFRDSDECEWPDYTFARRSEIESEADKTVDIILLDSLGELRVVYRLAEIVFVGGSLIPHGGQSILEPAAAGKAIVTGSYTHNFETVVEEFLARGALIRVPKAPQKFQIVEQVYEIFIELLGNAEKRLELGKNAFATMESNRGATRKTLEHIKILLNYSE